ncbi:uncharacterized protein LOC129759509 [Uranotaenia lowii]|uniref:uncharacterized protein LOC129759509 n=1 Tax=Uranotaenia lowii TaxID=190385 RepID=UPI002478615C|nr:uncharacterized protein LOC129759509 [Uranotaenia lowii]
MVPITNPDGENSAPAAEERLDRTANCQSCNQNDSFDDMVQCDKCDTWWHYRCVGVSESIKSRDWICPKCVDASNNPRPASNSSSALKRLKERQELERQRIDIELRQKFLDEQNALINGNGEEFQSFQSRASIAAAEKRTKEWVESIHSDNGTREKAPAASATKSKEPLRAAANNELAEPNNQRGMYPGRIITDDRLVEFQRQLQQCQEMLAALSPIEHNAESTRMIPSDNHGVNRSGAIPKTVKVGNALVNTEGFSNWKPTSADQAQTGEEHLEPSGKCQAYPTLKRFAQINRPTINNMHVTGQLRQESARPSYPSSYPNYYEAQPSLYPEDPLIIPSAPANQTAPATFMRDSRKPTSSFPRAMSEIEYYRSNLPINHSQLPQSTPRVRMRTNPHENVTPSEFLNPVHLTAQQLAARQSFARELPIFTGDPAEWPVFIGNYEYTTAVCGYTNGENMLRLQRSLKGYALESVRSRLVLPAAIPQVIEALRSKFGRPDFLINSLLQKVRAIPVQRSGKLESLIEYGEAVQELCDHIEAANEHANLANPQLLQELIEKLPDEQKMKWAEYRRDLKDVDLRIFGDYMTIIARDASSVVSFKPQPRSFNREKPKSKGFLNTHTESVEFSDPSDLQDQQRPTIVVCIFCNKSGHRLKNCYKFKDLSVEERWQQVRLFKACFSCLGSHGRRACRSGIKCNIEGCDSRHHPLLHSYDNLQKNTLHVAEVYAHHTIDSATIFRIIPVTLHGPSCSLETYAFIDEGSDLTLVEHDLVAQLGLKGSLHPLCLRWTANTTRVENKSMIVNLEISGIRQKRRSTITNARTVQSLNLPAQNFNAERAADQNEHLRGIPIKSYSNAKPQLLIGIDNLRLAVPLKVRERVGSGVIAAKTRLGWCVYGKSSQENNVFHSFHICESTTDELHELVKLSFNVDNISTTPTIPLSQQDQRAMSILEHTTRRVGDHFETGLLWIDDEVILPDAFNMALRRLECLERRMNRNPKLKENLHRQIEEYVSKKYVHKATNDELEHANTKRTWYLPLGAVINPKKPEKVRIIWDAAAEVSGVSLNKNLLKGPDLLSSLPGILFQFRLFHVAVSSDVQEMFHQIQIRPEDRNAQRFLWRSDPSHTPDVYLMDVATFGSTCSPASAQFVKNLNAEQHSSKYPDAAKSIIHRYYVDDYFESFDDVNEAKRIVGDIRTIQKNAGFTLHNWRSNSIDVLNHIQVLPNSTEKELNFANGAKLERVLGMLWNPSTDELGFSTHMSNDVRDLLQSGNRPTKRQILRCVMSLFDPLGLLAPFIVHGKVIIQDLWRSGISWDEEVGDLIHSRWNEWTKMIEHIDTIRISRCYFVEATKLTYSNTELHIFVDASEIAYSCVAYIRIIRADGSADLSLVSGKSKVAPLKPMSIPRLELQSCFLGAQLSIFIRNNHDITFSRTILWTDSRTALSWIHSDPRNYRPFVAHRVGEILERTTPANWRWVPSKSNPADEATKWGSGPYFTNNSSWFTGPNFLRLPESNWPTLVDRIKITEEELRASVFLHVEHQSIIEYDRFSRWERLYRAIAYVSRFLKYYPKHITKLSDPLEQSDLVTAVRLVIKQVQLETFPREITTLKQNPEGAINPGSSLRKYAPFLAEDGLLRENSRIRNSESAAFGTRFPIILPTKHRVTFLVVDWYHRRYKHANFETVVNEVRQLYTIPGLRSLAKKVSRGCQMCRLRNAKPVPPPMAPLPLCRLADRERPFTFTGLDYFGPLFVIVGRSRVKRWIALFTCLTTRAIHLEVVYSLSTASCIFAVRRFVARRGAPAEFYSDNGTNFVGASNILREQIRMEMKNTFTNCNTKWHFNPPGAPHMGGVWERLVRSVKMALNDGYNEGKLDDEGLMTLIVEAEGIVNSRPLTYLPLDSAEYEALTPNHFLLGSSNGIKQPPVPMGQRGNLRDSWDLIQHELNIFWDRWIKEYLPVIRRQTKWFESIKPIKVGDLVMVVDNKTRNGWIRGRIRETIPAPDGNIRSVIVDTVNGPIRRAVHYLAALDVTNDSVVSGSTEIHPGEDVSAAGSPAVGALN